MFSQYDIIILRNGNDEISLTPLLVESADLSTTFPRVSWECSFSFEDDLEEDVETLRNWLEAKREIKICMRDSSGIVHDIELSDVFVFSSIQHGKTPVSQTLTIDLMGIQEIGPLPAKENELEAAPEVVPCEPLPKSIDAPLAAFYSEPAWAVEDDRAWEESR